MQLGQSPDETKGDLVASGWFDRYRLGRPEWANLIFTAIAILGGLFCAFYFFNGADVVRTARNWPREYFYARPVSMDANGRESVHTGSSIQDHFGVAKTHNPSPGHSDRLISLSPFLPPASPGAFAPMSPGPGMVASGGSGGTPNSGTANQGALPPTLSQPPPTGDSVTPAGQDGGDDRSAGRSMARANRGRSIASAHQVASKQHGRRASRGPAVNTKSIAYRLSHLFAQTKGQVGHRQPGANRMTGGSGRTARAGIAQNRGMPNRGGAHSSAQKMTGHGPSIANGHGASSGQSAIMHGQGFASGQNQRGGGAGDSSMSSMNGGIRGMGSTGVAAGVGSASRGGAPAGPGAGGGGLGGGFHGHGGGHR